MKPKGTLHNHGEVHEARTLLKGMNIGDKGRSWTGRWNALHMASKQVGINIVTRKENNSIRVWIMP